MTSRTHQLNLMETFRTVFYTPIYVSVAGGFLEAEGLEVTFSTCPSQFPHPLSALNHGAADVTQSGIMRSIIASDWGAETVPLHFAKINARDGFFILSRTPQERFSWDSLKGSRVLPVGFSPMPWASFQYSLRRHGVSLRELDLIQGLSLDESMAAFRDGKADFIHLPEPAVEQLLADGTGHMAAALGPDNGHIAYSSFAATHRFISENSEVVERFVQGFAKALHWIESNDASEIGTAVSTFFPDVDKELIIKAVYRYKSQGTWPTDPRLDVPEFEGLQDILMAAGLVKEHQPYEKVVFPDFAKAVVA